MAGWGGWLAFGLVETEALHPFRAGKPHSIALNFLDAKTFDTVPLSINPVVNRRDASTGLPPDSAQFPWWVPVFGQ